MFKRGILQSHANIFDTLLRAIDPLLIVLAACLAYRVIEACWTLPNNYLFIILLTALLVIILLPTFSIYGSWRGGSISAELRTLLLAWGSVFIVLQLVTVATKTSAEFSRAWMVYWGLIATGLLIFSRIILRYLLRWLRSQGFNQRRIVIVGTDELASQVANRLRSSPWIGLEIAGFFNEHPVLISNSIMVSPILGDISHLTDYINTHPVHQVWLAIPWSRQKKIDSVLHELRNSTVEVRMVPDIFSYRLLNSSMTEVAGMPVLDLSRSPMHGFNRLIKALQDRILALLILTAISPLMIAIAIGVKFSSPGPVLFRQKRHGYDGKEVEVWKFRTMVMHKEKHDTLTQARRNDPRVTRFGAFLRRTSLDELPQFINVLQGSMSIVGPRPHALVHNEYYKHQIDRYMLRHKVKPGITGWAQINGLRGETETLEKMQKRVEYDLYYIENWSLWFDLKIIFFTVFKGLAHKNAY